MSLIENDLFRGKIDKVAIAIDRLRHFEPAEGYYLAFSGGKDSCVIKALADMAKVKYDAHYSNTTIDPPELIYFMREHHKDIHIEQPEMPLLKKLETKGFPIRQSRWCCDLYKENGGDGRFVMTGIRRAESNKRNGRRMIENCFKSKSGKRFMNVIIDWNDADVWDFLKSNNIPYCKLYDEGFKRIGCLLCPMASQRERERECVCYPRYVKLFIKSFKKLYLYRQEQTAIKKEKYIKKFENKLRKDGCIDRRYKGAKDAISSSVDRWKDGEEMFWWWIRGEGQGDPDQTVMFE